MKYSILKSLYQQSYSKNQIIQADLRGADLRGADLSDADLRGADLRGADLSDADLSDADLSDANLRGADLSDADLRYADLSDADLRRADLRGANLRGADLRRADLSDADLRGADLRGAELRFIRCGDGKIIKSISLRYLIVLHKNVLCIGCKRYTIEEWFNFSDVMISGMDTGALNWWNKHKNLLREFCNLESKNA